ncbi:UNVERIFIED_CONTAM: putative leucine-rich repeat receptor-like serine/threonine-protein kinase [Sesamum latifolium]|uniref:Leucine-rich repeat receptor-like serine/threonine-protein kinase n=1 Tax=Sesamum latifolium TaxID=2727402 RepID=A0AAW2Y3D1_9LAMI
MALRIGGFEGFPFGASFLKADLALLIPLAFFVSSKFSGIPIEMERESNLCWLLGLESMRLLAFNCQLDNNFNGSTITSSYGNRSHLVKLSLRNCSLRGSIPGWSNMSNIAYIDLSYNDLNGTIPASFSKLPR